jgi:toxin ParE1/3/4
MRQLIRSSQSDNDLVAIWRYIALDSPEAATRMLRRLEQRMSMLPQFPEIGERQPQFGENTRRIIEGNYLLFYDVLPNAVHVLRVYHAARKLDDLFD